MIDLEKDCEMFALSTTQKIIDFDCGDIDLNEFFNIDAEKYQKEMLAETYFFKHITSSIRA